MKLSIEKPADNWKDASLSGNGVMGVMMMGGLQQESLIGSHYELYLPLGTREELPDMAPHIHEFRRLIKEEGYKKAFAYYLTKAEEQGYPGLSWTDPFHPGFYLDIGRAGTEPKGFSGTRLTPLSGRCYKRVTDFDSGELCTSFTKQTKEIKRKVFVSRKDNFIHILLEGEENLSLGLRALKSDKIHQEFHSDNERVINRNVYKNGKGGYNVFLKILQGQSTKQSSASLKVDSSAGKIHVILRIESFTQSEADRTVTKLPQDMEDCKASYDEALREHTTLHKELMDSTQLNLTGKDELRQPLEEIKKTKWKRKLSAELLEQIYQASRYNIICATGANPPNLQGIWAGTMKPAWSGDFTTDTNVQLAIASYLSCDTPRLLLPFFDFMDRFMDDFRENARKLYGCRGILLPSRISNTGLMLHWDRVWPGQLWTCGASWMAHWYWDYYEYTGDREFLEKRAIPYMEDCFLFLKDFLVKDEDGTLRFTPSYSAEQPWGSFNTDNSTMDIAVSKELLKNLIKAGDICSVASEKRKEWEDMLHALPSYVIDEKEGFLLEWARQGAPDFPRHRHFSNLYPMNYSYEFTPEETPGLWKASEKAYERRLKHWVFAPFSDKSTHGRMHAALTAAYLGRGKDIERILKGMVTGNVFYSTLTTSHNPRHHIFNLDGNGAIPEIINNSLLFAREGTVHVLPALFESLKKGHLKKMKLRGNILVKDFIWDRDQRTAEGFFTAAETKEVLFSMRGESGFSLYLNNEICQGNRLQAIKGQEYHLIFKY